MSDFQSNDLFGENVPEIASLLDELEQLAPTAEQNQPPVAVVYRIVEDDEAFNDALDDAEDMSEPDTEMQDWRQFQNQQQLPFIEEINIQQLTATPMPVVAIDSGLARLGETEDGLIIALRGTIVSVV